MRYISLFSGIEAATLAWEPLGWEAVAFAEIEPFPSAVLAHRWPEVPNLGDVTKVDWRPYLGAVDVVVGGSPCQTFSLAGGRQGLVDSRGQLMLEYVRAVAEIEPRWFLWENVPGVLSQDRGRAFGTLLREMDELGYGVAWRVLDAQFFGVAQRRRRVFLVGRLGTAGGGASAVLFEPESVSGNTDTCKQKREALAAEARGGSSGAGSLRMSERDEPAVAIRTAQTGANGIGIAEELAHTIDTTGPEAVAFKIRCGSDTYVKHDGSIGTAGKGLLMSDELTFTIAATQDQSVLQYDTGSYVVRRLTPRECERLQGMPDDYTLVPYRGKPAEECPDGVRYKAIGNSMAVPCMAWIGRRLQEVDELMGGDD